MTAPPARSTASVLGTALSALLRRSEHLQSHDPGFVAELAAWTRDGPADDGVPRWAGGPRADDGSVLALRDYGGPDPRAERRFEQDPLVAVLTTRGTPDSTGSGPGRPCSGCCSPPRPVG